MTKKHVHQILGILMCTMTLFAQEHGGKRNRNKDKCPKFDCPITKTVCPVFDGENGRVVTSNVDDPNNPDPNTLRGAIIAANASNASKCNPFVIEFELGIDANGFSIINLDNDLPIIKKPVCINGFSNTGASESKRILNVMLCESGSITNGLVLDTTACGSTIKGLIIGSFVAGSGILVRASHSLIAGNNIGDVSDDIPPCSSFVNANQVGITIEGAECVTVGGLCPHERNVISGNSQDGIRISSNNVTVVGNYVGTDVSGLLPRGNRVNGIRVEGNKNVIGCQKKWGGNLVSSNGGSGTGTSTNNGVAVTGSGNRIVNCIIGLDKRGTRALGNRESGIALVGTYNTVSECVVSGNDDNNISIVGSYNKIVCSLIGTDIHGKKAFISTTGVNLNGETGPKITDNVIACNVITVRNGIGITIADSSSNVIEKNRIGTDCDGFCALGQRVGIRLSATPCNEQFDQNRSRIRPYDKITYAQAPNSRPYVRAEDTTGTCPRPCGDCDQSFLDTGCCSTLPQANFTVDNCIKKNLIAGNAFSGIELDISTRFTQIEHNLIGINKKCCFVPNGYGIYIAGAAQNNIIRKNVIAGNLSIGVAIQGAAPLAIGAGIETLNNSVTKNSIYCNGGSGIRLASGGNGCLGAPLITQAIICDDHLDVTIEAASLPENVPFTIELYANKRCRKCISEGQLFLCCKTVKEPLTEDELKLRVKLPCPEFKFITATVTELTSCFSTGNTSEFSCPVEAEVCVKEPIEIA